MRPSLGALPFRAAAAGPPRHSLRLRLTLLYGGFFLVSGAALLAIVYALALRATSTYLFAATRLAGSGHATVVVAHGPSLTGTTLVVGHGLPAQLDPHARSVLAHLQQLQAQSSHQHAADLHNLIVDSAIAFGIMALISVAIGWLVAGRALRPLRLMTAHARRISEQNLHERLALEGPDDEVKHLADTVDALLGRLETAFGAQRRFVANVAHELRTPLTLERALIEVALADPSASARSLRSTCERVLAAGQEHERLIESLLTLASSERGLERREPFDLAEVTRAVVLQRQPEARRRSVEMVLATSAAPVLGAPHLVERLVANLLDNALRYNLRGGLIEIVVGLLDGGPAVAVRNTGPRVPPDELERLFRPFERLDDGRPGPPAGRGLGLSIVQAIAAAHGANLSASARTGGGLEVQVSFPLADGEPVPGTGETQASASEPTAAELADVGATLARASG
ncbi:MAG TPA: ATP-binding protein [Acidimicrobiales bacterium]|nr:ATP-binding protein [Acidimicrobiales bacterium]